VPVFVRAIGSVDVEIVRQWQRLVLRTVARGEALTPESILLLVHQNGLLIDFSQRAQMRLSLINETRRGALPGR